MLLLNCKNLKKIIALGLTLVMTVPFISGCASNPPSKGEETSDNAGGSNAETTETIPEKTGYSADYLPGVDYGGYEFRVVACPSELSGMHTSIIIEEETGDPVNDAIYRRNRIVEEKYGIKFTQIDALDWAELDSEFQKSVVSGSDDFDLGQMAGGHAFNSVVTGKAVLPKNLPYIDVSQPWYVQGVNEQFTIAGKMFLAYSDECLNLLEQTQCVLFNKKLVDDLLIESPYDFVRNSTWTVDKFFDMAKSAAADLNGDGQMTDTDRYGIVSTHDFFYPNFWVSSGIKPISKDADGLLVFIQNPEKLYNILEKVYEKVNGDGKILFEAHNDAAPSFKGLDAYNIARRMFSNNQGLFYPSALVSVQELRSMDTDFGIIPFPKYDEAQEKYYTNGWDGWIYCVPVTNTDLERTSVIMEALAVESKNLVIPEFLETALHTKYVRDDESLDMLNIIEQNRTMDFSIGIVSKVRMCLVYDGLAQKKNNFASLIEKDMNQIEKRLEELNDAALSLD